jgi:serine phosphatase RsbU (regulator of sigma subunit)
MTTIAIKQRKFSGADHGLLRVYCWLTAIVYPSWSFFLYILMPQEYDDPVGRCLLGGLFFLIGLVSVWSKNFVKWLEPVVYFCINIVALHFFWLVHKSEMSTIYVLGSLIVACAYSGVFSKRNPLLHYSILLQSLAILVSLTSDGPLGNKLMLNAGILTIQVVALSNIILRLSAIETLELEKNRSLLLRQQLVDNELEAAEAVQKTLLSSLPDLPSVDLQTYYRAATRTGGDWYGQYLDRDKRYLYMWVGDVTGHGIPSALITGVACGALYSGEKRADRLKASIAPAERLYDMACVVNEIIFDTKAGLLMTMSFFCVDLKSGLVFHLNAGHCHPYVIGSDVKQLQNRGDPLGFRSEPSFVVKEHQLLPGDTIFMYTDGLIENGVEAKKFARRGLRKSLVPMMSASEVIDTVVKKISHLWADDPIADDVTMLALTWMPKERLGDKLEESA